MKAQRILISGGLAVGGAQTHVTLLCRVLRRAGAEVTVAAASTNWPDEAIAALKALGARVIVSPFGFGAFRVLGKVWAFLLWPFLLRRDYDVVYCVGEGRMHLWAGRFAGTEGWKIYHEIVECPAQGSVAAEVAARMDAVVANSRRVGREMAGMLPHIPVRALPFLTSDGPMRPPARQTRVPERTLRIAFLGRMVPHKRPDRLIEAWPAWNARAPIGPARLDLHGGDYDKEGDRLRARIADLGLEESVCLHGAYTTGDLGKIFDAADMVVLPSLYEGLPLVLVEAMQRGIPVVATSAGGTAELGEENPDVIITAGTDWEKFEAGVVEMARRVRAGDIDGGRLQDWTESRYGFNRVAEIWRRALLTPELFFAKKEPLMTEAKLTSRR
ncbi:MAG TPA: glycosyltransferase family 4 protein [Candidatus Methylacidiphilales bacterium]|nr:glycosyltransferase family 4 protein [Candidatus Methylacidiphilales bacterium]